MGYDPKATLVRKEVKQLANGDRLFLKLMKKAIRESEKSKSRRFSDPATSQKFDKSSQDNNKA